MRERLKLSICSLRGFFRRGQSRGAATPLPVKGSMRGVIVVKPENSIFSEALFVLSDEYMRTQGVSSQELLRQATEAAARYSVSQGLAGKGRGHMWLWALPAAGAAAALCLLLL